MNARGDTIEWIDDFDSDFQVLSADGSQIRKCAIARSEVRTSVLCDDGTEEAFFYGSSSVGGPTDLAIHNNEIWYHCISLTEAQRAELTSLNR